MISKRLLWALIAVTTAIFSAVFVASQGYGMAALAFVAGSIWIVLEINNRNEFSWLFFLAFLGGAVVGSLQNLSLPMLVLGLSTNLAAWDLSRFQSRTKAEPETDMKTLMERRHVQKLFVTLGVALIIAMVPLFIRLSISFVALAVISLVAMLVLRGSVLSLRRGS